MQTLFEDDIFEHFESNVRSYSRKFPETFGRASGSYLYSEGEKPYLDFFMGAGALNYGHNPPYIKERLLSYLANDGIMHGLDMQTSAKKQFLQEFVQRILQPRHWEYRVQFCGPTGTNAVEAALKLARKVTHRPSVIAFTGAFHGVSLGSLAVSGDRDLRMASGSSLPDVTFMPYPYGPFAAIDTIAYLEGLLDDPLSGMNIPAAIIVEVVQAEGGVIPAPHDWLVRLRKLCTERDILLICDEIQTGCWRTGPFFAFEHANIVPDIVTVSKSISGYGLPMSLVLIHPTYDQWFPGEHSGTFRGNQLAFVSAAAALEYASMLDLEGRVCHHASVFAQWLDDMIAATHLPLQTRGVGFLRGLDFTTAGGGSMAERVQRGCFERGLLVEAVGRNNAVLKLLPPLTIELEDLKKGCAIIHESVAAALS